MDSKTQIIIQVDPHANQSLQIDMKGLRTWSDVYDLLQQQHKIDISGKELWYTDMKTQNKIVAERDSQVLPYAITGTVSLVAKRILITVMDQDFTHQIKIAATQPVRELIKLFREGLQGRGIAAHSWDEEKAGFSFQGQKLHRDRALCEYGIDDNAMIRGRYPIRITDVDSATNEAVVYVNEWTELKQMSEQYGKILSRKMYESFEFLRPNVEDVLPRETNGHPSTMWELQLVPNEDEPLILEYNPPEYIIYVKLRNQRVDTKELMYGNDRKDEKVPVTVSDFWTANNVLAAYNNAVNQLYGTGAGVLDLVATAEDKLIFRQDVLEEKKELYKYKIEVESVLELEKHDPNAITMRYICADCGFENSLTKEADVVCKDCGFRILYKKRTEHPSVFFAR